MKGDITKIYGVNFVGSQNPNELIRTNAAQGLKITVGTPEITSDFDNCYPWSDIEEVTDEFGNVFIKIPKFYSKITKNSDGTYLHQLSGTKYSGFDTLFKIGEQEIDYVMVGKYEGSGSSSRVYSKSGQTPLVSITMGDFRNGCKANGAGYQQYDFLIDLIIKELWLVEMKTTNCQSIMCGYVNNNSAPTNTGTTDSVTTPSGSPVSNTDGKHACKYRGIENPWGNIDKWCDGILFQDSSIFICTQPYYYNIEKLVSSYEYYGEQPRFSGFVKTVAPLKEHSLIQYVTLVGATNNTYYSDFYQYAQDGLSILAIGGNYNEMAYFADDGMYAGLWYYNNNNKRINSQFNTHGGRLCYKPSQPLPTNLFNPKRNQILCKVLRKDTTQQCSGLKLFPTPNGYIEAHNLQPESWIDQNGDLIDEHNRNFEYLNSTHPFDASTGGELENYTNLNSPINTKDQREIGECCLQSKTNFGWKLTTWVNNYRPWGNYIWTDGDSAYNSYGSGTDRLNVKESKWETQEWVFLDQDSQSVKVNTLGPDFWTDGKTFYLSLSNQHFYRTMDDNGVLTNVWRAKIWNGAQFWGQDVWTDGQNIYASRNGSNYYLTKDDSGNFTDTWATKQWYGLDNSITLYPPNIWKDGDNVYYSAGDKHYYLTKDDSGNFTDTWATKQWYGLDAFYGDNVWTDGNAIYMSDGDSSYKLNKEISTWKVKDWKGVSGLSGVAIWNFNGVTYYSPASKPSYQLDILPQYNVWTDLKRVQIDTPAGPRVVQTQEPATWDDTKFWVEGWDEETDTHMVQVKRHPQLTNKTLNIDCYMTNIDDLYTGLETCTLSYEDDPDGNSGTWFLKKGDSTYITLKVTQTQKQEGQS